MFLLKLINKLQNICIEMGRSLMCFVMQSYARPLVFFGFVNHLANHLSYLTVACFYAIMLYNLYHNQMPNSYSHLFTCTVLNRRHSYDHVVKRHDVEILLFDKVNKF